MIDVLLNPLWWGMALVCWLLYAYSTRGTIPIHRKFDKRSARPGEFYRGGSTATSKTEKRVRDSLIKSGFKLYPSSLMLFTPKDENGKHHKYTPDIVIKHPKMVVEVDPEYTHSGQERIAHDIDRNRMYARMGFRIVRVRIGRSIIRLTPNDLVIEKGDFDHIENGADLARAVRRAKFYPPGWFGKRPPRMSR